MRFHSEISDDDGAGEAVSRVIAGTRAALGDAVDVAFLFFTGHHRDDAEAIVERVWLEVDPEAVIGCSAEGVIGGELEVERKPGVSLLAASMPGVRVHGFHVRGDDWHEFVE